MTRMVRISLVYLLDVEASDAEAAENIAQDMLDSGKFNPDSFISYSVEDCGDGSWDE